MHFILSIQQVRLSHLVEGSRSIVFLFATVCLLSLWSTAAVAAGPDNQETKHFDIPQQRADTSLITFAEQADITLIFTFELARDKTTNRLVGSYHPNEAIQLLLDGTGLEPTFSSDGHINIALAEVPVAEGNEMKTQTKVGLLAAFFGAFSGTAFAQDDSRGDFAIEEIIVTAQKREQNLQDVGLSVTALDSTAIDRAGITDISRLEFVTPGVTYGHIGTDSKIAIRGANSNNTYRDNSSIAAAFIDGVYQTRASQQRLGYFDVERMEILKGPQGTLYGRNSFAGAVNLYTNRPSTEAVQFGVDVTASRFNMQRIEMFANAPISDTLAFRLAGVTASSDGHIKNIGLGDNLGAVDQDSYRLSAFWSPRDNVEVLARYTSTRDGGTSEGVFAAEGLCVPVNSTGVTDMLESQIDCTNPKEGSLGVDARFDVPYEVNYSWDSFRDVKSDNFTLDVTWDLESVAIRSITSYTDFETAYTTGSMNGKPGATGFFDELTESTTQEIQLISTGNDRLQWTLGGYYSDDDILVGTSDFDTFTYENHSIVGYDDAGNEITTYHPTALIDVYGGGDFDDGDKFQLIGTKTEGLFGQVEWSIMDDVRLIGGLRQNKETKTSSVISGDSGFTAADAPFGFIGLVGRPLHVYDYDGTSRCETKVVYEKTTWRAGIEWDLGDDSMLYGNGSNGFLSGGLNSNCSSFDQQDSEAMEIGYKSRWADNKVQFNAAYYHNEYTNLTAQELIFIPGEGTAAGSWSTITLNGGDITVDGAELELIWLASEALSITANVSYMDAVFGKFGVKNPFQLFDGVKAGDTTDENGIPLDGFVALDGTTPGWSPELTFGLTAAYDKDLGSNGMLTTYIQFYYSDDYNTDDVSLYSTQVQEAYTKTDLRLTWRSPDERYSVTAFVENIEDEAVLSRTNTGSDDLVQGSYAFPRNYGLKFSYRY